ncbi:hypothetical protein CTheo_7613 [Ceratobasidium theobromae]|uniref:Uncharacterized protein n=1 Tax=Ceratobasidium theobromae TaxID=1582974 RepID=A0A5N5QBA7_9AGAM|nr:hypothetical protein CTheo_7613 [Ceratobasidium theobromae]
MDIFKKHAGLKPDAMRDLVARVEAQVAGRSPPNPLPSGAAPLGCKVDQSIVEEVMAMHAVVDMRKCESMKSGRRRFGGGVRAAKADGGKRKQDREARREQRRQDREQRKRIEQEAVQGMRIRAARELHERIMAMNKRKRDDNGSGSQGGAKRHKDDNMSLDENGRAHLSICWWHMSETLISRSKKPKVRVPNVDENGNPLTREQRKALKKAILATQVQTNPLKRKPTELEADQQHPGLADETDAFPHDISPSKRRRRDAGCMADLTQQFSIGWASPTTNPTTLPPSDTSHTLVPVPTNTSSFGEFTHSSESQDPSSHSNWRETTVSAPSEVPRRFSQQLAAYALESGMFDGENFELFTEDTFPGMSVDVNQGSSMASLLQPGAESHTPVQGLVTPVETSTYTAFAPSSHGQNHPPPSPYSSTSTVTPTNGDPDSDMSWINVALAQLPSEHGAQHQHPFPQASGSQDASGFSTGYVGNPNAFTQPTPVTPTESRVPVSHQRTPLEYPSPQHKLDDHSRIPSHPSAPFQSSFSRPQSRPRAPGGLWQTSYSQPAHQQHQHQQYHEPPSPFSAPSPAPPRSFPAPVQQQYEPSHERRGAYTHPSASPQHEYQHAPVFPQPQSAPAPTPAPPTPDAASILKQHELEFARSQEDLRNRFKREQGEQLARFLRAQEDLRKQLLPDGSRSKSD